MLLAGSAKFHPLGPLDQIKAVEQGCILDWNMSNECCEEESQIQASLQHAQWLKDWQWPVASHHLSKAKNFQTHTFTATEASWLIIISQCYIKVVRLSQSVLLLFSGWSLTLAPSPQVQDGKMRNWFRVEQGKVLPYELITIQGNGIGESCCCCDYIVVRKDIRDPLATMKELFVSFRFIVKPSSDNLRLITIFLN